MGRKLSIGVLAAALVISGLMVGVSFGGSGGISEPQVIALHDGEILAQEGRQTKVRLMDEDGADVGTYLWDCSHAVSSSCTNILTLRAGAHTERGSIVLSGIFRGFNGEKLAVTGGTGAYQNVRGYAQLTVEDEEFVHTLYLIP